MPKRNLERPSEEPRYGTPERHAPRGTGLAKLVNTDINGTYKQPWVEHDGVTDHEGDAKIG